MDYQNGKIYRLINNEMPDLVYYGSTCTELRKRLCQHKSDTKRKNNSSKILFEFGKVEIILVEKYPCSDKSELISRERFYIENNKCINKIIPSRTVKEYREDNKEKIKEYSKQYRKNNKEKIKGRVECECGSKFMLSNKSRHLKSKKHINHFS